MGRRHRAAARFADNSAIAEMMTRPALCHFDPQFFAGSFVAPLPECGTEERNDEEKETMLFMLKAHLEKPAGTSNKEFYGAWKQEAEAALAALKAGAIKAPLQGRRHSRRHCDFRSTVCGRSRSCDRQSAHMAAGLLSYSDQARNYCASPISKLGRGPEQARRIATNGSPRRGRLPTKLCTRQLAACNLTCHAEHECTRRLKLQFLIPDAIIQI
jgi:hypothetical protein